MSQLTPCPECQRHVRKTETSCPFCQTALSLSHLPDHALPRKRLGRAATFAFGATVAGATALGACDDSATVAPPYGLPGGSSFAGIAGAPPSGSSSGGNNNGDAGASTAIYGAPAAGTGGDDVGGAGGKPGDGGAGGDSGDGGAGGDPSEGGAAPIYGGPPGGAGGNGGASGI